MTIPSLPQTLIPAVSFLAWFVVNWLKHSTLPPWANALIALLVPVFVAWLWALASNVLTAPSLWGNIAIIVVLSYAALALPELETWRQWLQDTFKSPFAWWPAPVTVEPQPTIRRASLMTSSRVSRIPFDSSFHPMPPVLPTGPMQAVQSPHTTQPMAATTPETPMPPTPVEESPAQS